MQLNEHTVVRLIVQSSKNFPPMIHKIVQSFRCFYRKPCITLIDPDHPLIDFAHRLKIVGVFERPLLETFSA